MKPTGKFLPWLTRRPPRGFTTGQLADHFGWDGVLWFYSGSAVIGCALLALTWNSRPKT